MRKALCVVMLGLGLFPLNGCGGDDKGSSDPVELCKQAAQAVCSRIFACYSAEELDAASATVGNNEADCVTKIGGKDGFNCTTEGVKCDSGETFRADKANECIDQFQSLSCRELKSETSSTPAACEQTCGK